MQKVSLLLVTGLLMAGSAFAQSGAKLAPAPVQPTRASAASTTSEHAARAVAARPAAVPEAQSAAHKAPHPAATAPVRHDATAEKATLKRELPAAGKIEK